MTSCVNWATLFAATLWLIWKMRNDLQFNNVVQRESVVAKNCVLLTKDITNAFEATTNDGPNITERLIGWTFPIAGYLKINTDGSHNPENNRGSFGGIVRSDRGKWVEGFCGYIGYSDSLKAELWGIRHALKLCQDRNWRSVEIETYCLVAVNLILDNKDEENHPCRALIDDCKELIHETGAKLAHILREANRCADVLAKLGSEQDDHEVRLLVPPDIVLEEMKCDMRGVAYGRGYC